MSEQCRPWWRNCGVEEDPDIREMDRWEEAIAPLSPEAARVRELISTLELCHHKAERWVANILAAIAAGDTDKGLGTRSVGQTHPVEQVWHNVCEALSAWCAGYPAEAVELAVGAVRATDLLACLGERSPLKEWQVQRVVDKIRSHLHFYLSPSSEALGTKYAFLLLEGGEYESAVRSKCPEYYREHEEFWRATVNTIIEDTANGSRQRLSLGIAIDMLWPCHWRFTTNLRIVLEAIGGQLQAKEPFAACGRNIELSPLRDRMQVVTNSLHTFCSDSSAGEQVDHEILGLLGESTEVKKWLAASLAKTISLQLNPPPEMRKLTVLSEPATA